MAKEKISKLIKSVTVSKPSNTDNYVNSGLSADSYIVLSAYETSNIQGASITIGASTYSGNPVFAFIWAVDGSPYRDAVTITFYYVDK